MHFLIPSLVVASIFLGGGATTAQAQSLGEVAKKEAERRKTVQGDAKVYTNKDLAGGPLAAPLPLPKAPDRPSAEETTKGQPAAAAGSGPTAGKEAEAKGKEAEAEKDAAPRDQTYWRERLQALQTALQRNATYVEALQSRVNALTTDFVNRDDPAQRTTIEADRQKALAELERLKKQIDDDRKALADLQEEARRAGVPAGWLR